jgi:transcription factor E
MHVKLLKDIIGATVGQSATGMADLLYGKKNVNEFIIAKKLKLTINQTRNILYKLSDEGLVNFIRKKDSKKGGWYTYFWTLNIERSLAKFKEKLQKDIEHLEQRIAVKRNTRFFVCNNCHIDMNEEQALLHDYMCPECGELLQLKDPVSEITELQKQIGKIKDVLTGVTSELNVILVVEAKKRTRKMKAEQKKVLTERAARRKLKEHEKKRAEAKKKRKALSRRNAKKKKHVKKKHHKARKARRKKR